MLTRVRGQFGFDGVDVDFEELDSVPKTDLSYGVLQFQRLTILRALRVAMPRPYMLTMAVWSVGGCDDTLCPAFAGLNSAGMDLPVLQDVAVRDSIDAFNVMSYYTGLEGNASLQLRNTVAAVAARGVAPARIYGGIMADGQYTLATAQSYASALRSQGYNVFLWDLSPQTSSFVAVM